MKNDQQTIANDISLYCALPQSSYRRLVYARYAYEFIIVQLSLIINDFISCAYGIPQKNNSFFLVLYWINLKN